MDILKGFFDTLDSNPEYLNYSETRSIQACFDSDKLPNMVPAFKLISHDHNCHITFSKETMNAIKCKSSEIKYHLNQEEEKVFLLNDELKVFSERMHNKCAVCFLNFRGVRINIMIDTFRKMMLVTDNLFLKHRVLRQKLQKSANNLKLLIDGLLAKFNQYNVNSPEYHNFLQQLQQSVISLGQGSSTLNEENYVVEMVQESSDDCENEYQSEDEYDDSHYYGRRHRRRWW